MRVDVDLPVNGRDRQRLWRHSSAVRTHRQSGRIRSSPVGSSRGLRCPCGPRSVVVRPLKVSHTDVPELLAATLAAGAHSPCPERRVRLGQDGQRVTFVTFVTGFAVMGAHARARGECLTAICVTGVTVVTLVLPVTPWGGMRMPKYSRALRLR